MAGNHRPHPDLDWLDRQRRSSPGAAFPMAVDAVTFAILGLNESPTSSKKNSPRHIPGSKIDPEFSTRVKKRSTGLKIKTEVPVKAGGFSMRIAHLSDAVRVGVGAFAGVGLLLGASGCLATRSWVGDQLRPITSQQQQLETQMSNLH